MSGDLVDDEGRVPEAQAYRVACPWGVGADYGHRGGHAQGCIGPACMAWRRETRYPKIIRHPKADALEPDDVDLRDWPQPVRSELAQYWRFVRAGEATGLPFSMARDKLPFAAWVETDERLRDMRVGQCVRREKGG